MAGDFLRLVQKAQALQGGGQIVVYLDHIGRRAQGAAVMRHRILHPPRGQGAVAALKLSLWVDRFH
ncbi:MAG: hypothetical protein VCD66_07325 [Alphaproteobacteria bacterium]